MKWWTRLSVCRYWLKMLQLVQACMAILELFLKTHDWLCCQHHLLDPLIVMSNLGVHTRNILLPAADAPRDDTSQLPHSAHFTDKRTASITLQTWNLLSKVKCRRRWLTLQASLPSSPPAQMKPGCRTKSKPSLVFFSFLSQSKWLKTGTSTSLRTFWYLPLPPKASLPHPLTKQRFPAKF